MKPDDYKERIDELAEGFRRLNTAANTAVIGVRDMIPNGVNQYYQPYQQTMQVQVAEYRQMHNDLESAKRTIKMHEIFINELQAGRMAQASIQNHQETRINELEQAMKLLMQDRLGIDND